MMEALSPEAAWKLLHELRVHQLELEMQNEALRHAQEELHGGRDRYFDLYDLAPVGYFLLSVQGSIIEANLTFATMLGLAKAELLNKPLHQFVFHNDQDLYYLQYRKLFETSVPSTCELRLVGNSGARFWIRLEMNLAQELDGVPVVRAMAIDITQRKQIEEAQQRSIEMQTILREIAEAAIVLSLDDLYKVVHLLVVRVLSAEHFLISLLDDASSEIVVAFRADAADDIPVRRPIARGFTEYVLRLGRTVHLTGSDMARLRDKGEYVLTEGQTAKVQEYLGAPLTDSQGTPFGVISLVLLGATQTFQKEDSEVLSIIAAQVSLAIERKQMQTALTASEARFRTLVENVNDIVYSITPEGVATYVSPNWTEVLGHGRSAIIGQQFTDFVHPSDQADCLAVFNQMVLTGEKHNGVEIRVRQASGEWRWYISSAKPVRDAEGKFVSIIGILHDIEARKRVETALQSSQTRYHALIEQSFEALALIDLETREIVEVNHRFNELLGYFLPADAPLCVNEIAMDLRSNIDRLYTSLLAGTQRVLPTEARTYRHKNGTLICVERAGTTINIDGRKYLLASLRDTAEERRRSAELARDVEVARQVQRALLTELPVSPLVAVRTLYYPSHFVSGDSYHLGWLNEGTLLRGYLVDVSGHGLATALQTASFSVLLREAATSKLSLHGQMKRINARAARCFTEGSYAALLGFELDLFLKELRYVGAGITQFFANGQKIETPGMFVGMWDDPKFITGVLPISPGDTFHFLTDGFSDALSQAENRNFWSPGGKDFDADMASLVGLAENGELRDDATGVCLKIERS